MFYSKTLLAKKSPLGTVWMAAHLEGKLRKPLVAGTDIQHSANYIMFPDVPIALRLSGHLLLGLVRIYSKKVDYLFHDCNILLGQVRILFAPAQINLPEDTNCAPYHSITLPETFDLDALELDDNLEALKGNDDHVKTLEDITLHGQVPAEGVTYIPIYISEDSTDPSSLSRRESLPAVPTEDETLPPFPMDVDMEIFAEKRMGNQDTDFHGPGPHTSGSLPNLDGHIGTEPSPDSGVMRNADNNFEVNGHIGTEPSPDSGVMRNAGNNFEVEIPEEMVGFGNDKMSRQDNLQLDDIIMEDRFPIGDQLPILPETPHSHALPILPTSVSADVPLNHDIEASLGLPAAELELQPSPPKKRQQAKKRKRDISFEEIIVLTNMEMKKQLKDTKSLVRKRGKLPISTLDVWKFQCRLQNENIFHAPLFSGCSNKLKEFCQKRYSAPVIENIDAEIPEVADALSPIENPRFVPSTIENLFETISPIENPLFAPSTNENFTETMEAEAVITASSPKKMGSIHCINENMFETMEVVNVVSPPERLQLDSLSGKNISEERPSPPGTETTPLRPTDNVSVSLVERTLESNNAAWTSNTDYTESTVPQFETPLVDVDDQLGFASHLSEIPSLSGSPASDDLNFLNTDRGTEGSPITLTSLPSRTMDVARYLKDQSPGALTLNESGDLSLNKILEGKLRKQCARMFFETLVLKSSGFINVQQKEAYGDITISLTSAFPK